MKISEMDRETLRDYMKGNGSIHRIDGEERVWQRAFDLAKAAGLGVDKDCPKCWARIHEWLLK